MVDIRLGGQHGLGGQCEHGVKHRHVQYAEDFWFLEFVSRHFRIDKEDLAGMVEIVDNMTMVDSKDT